MMQEEKNILWGMGEIGKNGQKLQTSGYKINQTLGCNIQHVTIMILKCTFKSYKK